MAARKSTTPPTTGNSHSAATTDPTRKCARCRHEQSQHTSNGATCWAKINCPCTGFARSKAETVTVDDSTSYEGGPETGLTMGSVAGPEEHAATDHH